MTDSVTPKPGLLTPAQIVRMSSIAPTILTPKPVPRPRKERSAPVRNTAFRDSEELRALQKQLNSRR